VDAAQLALFKGALAQDQKKVVLASHFTFVSYGDAIANTPPRRGPRGAPAGSVSTTGGYTDQDYGTFERRRSEVYGALHGQRARVQCVLTGHSHRKGLYFLTGQDRQTFTDPDGVPYVVERFGTAMFPMVDAEATRRALAGTPATPIIVSDSAGPVPRMNDHDELLEWGSDAPAGTLVTVSREGKVEGVAPVRASGTRAKPRLVVALDYLQVMNDLVLEEIATGWCDLTKPFGERSHRLEFTFRKGFPERAARLRRVGLYCKVARDAGWTRLGDLGAPRESRTAKTNQLVVTFDVRAEQNDDLFKWLAATASCPRFLSLGFEPVDPFVKQNYECMLGSRWNFEAKVKKEGLLAAAVERVEKAVGVRARPLEGAAVRWVVKPVFEIPRFDVRRQFFPEQYT
jgi:hypothetical protein